MKILASILAFAASLGAAHAGAPAAVPEMDAAAGVAALALIVGAAAIIREKFFRK